MHDQTRPLRPAATQGRRLQRVRRVSIGLVGAVALLVTAMPLAGQASDATAAGRAVARAARPLASAVTTKAKRPRPTPTPTATTTATTIVPPPPTPTPAPIATATPSPAPTATAIQPPASTPPSTRYVSTSGSDGGDGSSATPWRTIQHAVDVAAEGTTVLVRAGTYASFAVTRPGLTVQPADGELVVVSGGTYVVLVRGTHDVTIRGLTIQDAPDQWGSGVRIETSTRVLIEGNRIHDNHSFGVRAKDASQVTLRDNDIAKNDTGIELSGAVDGSLVSGNRIHDNDRMVTSSRGGNGIVFTKTLGAIVVTSNRLWGNRAPHLTDSGYDGGAFEVYGASDLRIEANVVWDNNNVMETGTDGTAPCARLTFVRNVAYGASSVPGEATGLILRCASDSLFAHNTFDGLDDYAFYVAAGGSYAGSIAGLRIEDNIVYRGRAYSLTSGLPTDLIIDHDLVRPGASTATYASHVAYVAGYGNTDDLAEFTTWTGFDAHGLEAEPRFADADGRDYRLTAGSPAIDAGVVSDGAFAGSAPDIGRYEYAP